MSSNLPSQPQAELHELVGAMDVLTTLREEFAQWLEEAQDSSKHESLENVLGHVEAMLAEYRGRLEGFKKASGAG